MHILALKPTCRAGFQDADAPSFLLRLRSGCELPEHLQHCRGIITNEKRCSTQILQPSSRNILSCESSGSQCLQTRCCKVARAFLFLSLQHCLADLMLLVGRFLLGCAGLSGCATDLGSAATTTYKNVVPAPQTVAPITQRPPTGDSHAMQ